MKMMMTEPFLGLDSLSQIMGNNVRLDNDLRSKKTCV